MNRVYFIGAGPGDPEFLTLKGARVLETCGTVFAPAPFGDRYAEYLHGKTILDPFDYYFGELLGEVRRLLQESPVAFLVPGDLTFYAPFQSVVDALDSSAEVVPGVGTANAASARLKKTLDLPGVCNRAVLASPRALGEAEGAPDLEDLAAPGVTLLIYMNNIPLADLSARLRRGYGKNVPLAILHRLGLPGEEVVTGTLDDIADKVGERDFFNLAETNRRPALTLVIVGETLAAGVDGTWWDYRRDRFWRFRDADAR